MSLVTEILTYDQLQDLWGAGFTVVRRHSDPFEIDPKLIPRGMSYQWNDAKDKPGWRRVPFSRHEGVFGPWGMPGDVYRDNLFLCERPKIEVEAELAQYRTKAEQNVVDWIDKAGALGFEGHVKVSHDESNLERVEGRKIGFPDLGAEMGMPPIVERPSTKTIETTVKIPSDMLPHMEAIFKERDRLEAEVVRKDRTLRSGKIADKFYLAIDKDPGAPWWPTLRAILLPIAVENVRANLEKETTDE